MFKDTLNYGILNVIKQYYRLIFLNNCTMLKCFVLSTWNK
jgi:hypothetical protein